RVALALFRIAEATRLGRDDAAGDLDLAGTAAAHAAARWKRDAGLFCGIEQRRAGGRNRGDAALRKDQSAGRIGNPRGSSFGVLEALDVNGSGLDAGLAKRAADAVHHRLRTADEP